MDSDMHLMESLILSGRHRDLRQTQSRGLGLSGESTGFGLTLLGQK